MNLKDKIEEPKRALTIKIVFAVSVRNNGTDDRPGRDNLLVTEVRLAGTG